MTTILILQSIYPPAAEVAECSEVLFPPLDASAIFAIVCMMNHSCQPNVEVQVWTRIILSSQSSEGPSIASPALI